MELKIKINSNKGEKTTSEDLDRTIDYFLPLIAYAEQEQRFKWKGIKVYPDGTKIILKKSD
jgi:hypothetical protein